MILYVLAVWVCAVGCVALIELFVLSLPQPAGSTLQDLGATTAGLSGQPPAQAAFLILGLALLLFGLVLGYLVESKLAPVAKLYRHLQQRYPGWYRRLPADKREILLAFGIGILLLLVALALALLSGNWLSLPLATGLGLGLSVLPVLRYRSTLTEDRPEQAPQAVLHKLVPDYSLERALLVGQIYLRLLLPVFALFCMLVLPLALNQLHLGSLETVLLLLGLFGGAGLGWLSQRESQLDLANFRRNLYQLCALSLLASGLLLFGVASENLIQMLLMSTFSGYLVGLY